MMFSCDGGVVKWNRILGEWLVDADESYRNVYFRLHAPDSSVADCQMSVESTTNIRKMHARTSNSVRAISFVPTLSVYRKSPTLL